MKKLKYGIENGVVGVYMITCEKNGKRYIGASKQVTSRFGQHMGRDAKLYPWKEFYKDVKKHGAENFKFELLEECNESNKIKREQYYFDKLKPEYNVFRPVENMFLDEGFREYMAEKARNNKKTHAARKERYNSADYKKKFIMGSPRGVPVDMFENTTGMFIRSFVSLHQAGKWLDINTSYKAKNKTSKVKAVCDGERNSAFGFIFRYSKESVETISKESTLVIDTPVEAAGV